MWESFWTFFSWSVAPSPHVSLYGIQSCFFKIQNKMRQIILGNGKAYGNVSTAQGCPPLILLWIVNNVPLCGTVLFLFEAGTPLLLSTPLCSFNIWVPSGICPSSPSSSLPANWTSLSAFPSGPTQHSLDLFPVFLCLSMFSLSQDLLVCVS